MKTLKNIALAAMMLTTAVSARAEWVNGHFRSNGTYVDSYYRTPANGTPYDNLSYRGYPSQQPGYVSPRGYGVDPSRTRPMPLPSNGNYNFDTMPHHYTGGYSPRTLPYYGDSSYSATSYPVSSTSRSYGNTAYPTLSRW